MCGYDEVQRSVALLQLPSAALRYDECLATVRRLRKKTVDKLHWQNMSTYVCVCMYVYVYVSQHSIVLAGTVVEGSAIEEYNLYTYIHVCICIYVYIYVYIYVCIYVCIYVYIYVYIYVCIYVYMYTWQHGIVITGSVVEGCTMLENESMGLSPYVHVPSDRFVFICIRLFWKHGIVITGMVI